MTATRYSDKIQEIALSVFETACYMFPLEEWELEDAGSMQQPNGTTRAVVRFEGAAQGGMVISPSEDLLHAIAANMLGNDAPDFELKQGALCEIANIICGNTVPLFARSNNICYIRPPRIADAEEDIDAAFSGLQKEMIHMILDEGVAELTIYYPKEDSL
jgi:CheY-specific phosphatase CheX